MPGRNIIKIFTQDSFYHIYNRGVNGQVIFKDKHDYAYFEWLLERTLSPEVAKDAKGREFTWLREELEMSAYCLMPNHFHMLVYQRDIEGVTKLMRTIATAYTMYFNKRYKRRGPLFENSYRAVPILQDSQLLHISRYIHLNHKAFRTWPHSSLKDYLTEEPRLWLETDRIAELFSCKDAYEEFVLDHEDAQRNLEKLKYELANAEY